MNINALDIGDGEDEEIQVTPIKVPRPVTAPTPAPAEPAKEPAPAN